MTDINPLNGTTPTTATTTPTGIGSLSDPNMFLQLLVAELKYQDPMNPSDPTQYLGQTAQFTMVQTLNTLQSEMQSLLTSSQTAYASSLIGRRIGGVTATGQTVEGTVTGLDMTTGTPQLVVGSNEVPIDKVIAVATAPAASSSSPQSPTSS